MVTCLKCNESWESGETYEWVFGRDLWSTTKSTSTGASRFTEFGDFRRLKVFVCPKCLPGLQWSERRGAFVTLILWWLLMLGVTWWSGASDGIYLWRLMLVGGGLGTVAYVVYLAFSFGQRSRRNAARWVAERFVHEAWKGSGIKVKEIRHWTPEEFERERRQHA